MRHLLPLLLLAGCANAQPFDLTVVNGDSRATFLSAGESTGVLIRIREEVGSQWVDLWTSQAAMCMPECGVLGGPIVCADMAAELGAVYGLLPGDSVSKSFDGDFWYGDTLNNCARRATLTGALRATVCHGPSAVIDSTGQVIEDIDESGMLEAPSGASVVSADCEELDFELSDPTVTITD
jgi:hypothetical protein